MQGDTKPRIESTLLILLKIWFAAFRTIGMYLTICTVGQQT